jgi:hypothetical protein
MFKSTESVCMIDRALTDSTTVLALNTLYQTAGRWLAVGTVTVNIVAVPMPTVVMLFIKATTGMLA